MRRNTIGNIPGTINAGNADYAITEVLYGEKDHTFNQITIDDLCKPYLPEKTGKKRLVIIQDYKNTELLQKIRATFNIHSLTMEDIVNTDQRCKYESYDNYDFIVINKFERNSKELKKKQISIIVMIDIVFLFIDESCDNLLKIGAYSGYVDEHIDDVLWRISEIKGRVCERDLGYLAYAFMDVIVDSYFEVIEDIEKDISKLDDSIENLDEKELLKRIFSLKREVIAFKKNTWPLREMINGLLRNEKSFIQTDERNVVFLRDLQDHIHRITETADALRDNVYSLVEIHMNLVSVRMNEVMKVLTVITTIFVPITFLTSVYGMNFDYIPELHVPHAYALFWLLVSGISVGLWTFFKGKKWL